MEQVSPTRSELLNRRAQIKLASQGAELLRGKREALVREFLSELKPFIKLREQMSLSLVSGTRSLIKAMAIDGVEALTSAAFLSGNGPSVKVEEVNIWGVKVANVKKEEENSSSPKNDNPDLIISSRIKETKDSFTEAVDWILKVAPLARKLRVLGDEIKKTSRRVNALEQRLIPRLNDQVRFIRDVLDQREREDIFRLKKLKKK